MPNRYKSSFVSEDYASYTTEDFLLYAERLENIQPHECYTHLYKNRKVYADGLRELSSEPCQKAHVESMKRLKLLDFTQ